MSVIVVPIDSSQIPAPDRKQQRVRVAIQQGSTIRSQVVPVDDGKAEVRLDVDPQQAVAIAVGPESASDQDVFHLQTLTATATAKQLQAGKQLSLAPIVVTPAWWSRWLGWCREFTISGRLACADGSPVPGAEVRAYDVDYFWWWSSLSQVGPAAITDVSGHFIIRFRWCCGWWPWWWWRLRDWRLEPLLVEKIQPVLRLNPALRFPLPSPRVALDLATSSPPPQRAGAPPVAAAKPQSTASRAAVAPPPAFDRPLDPAVIPALRDKLVAALPHVPELERLRIWPWWPWTPWFDCTPDIIFRATQTCGGLAKVILDETIFQTRWDIPTSLDVNLVANQEACCLAPTPQPPAGDCYVFSGVCGDPGIPVTSIGASGATAGFADPGASDRPFAEVVNLQGEFGSSSQADYYGIEYSSHGANSWQPVPAAALLDIERGYFDANQPWPHQWFYVGFPVTTAGAKQVYESRHHYELRNPANWGSALSGRSWFYNVNLIASLETSGSFADGVYDFRVVGYRALAGGGPDLTTYKVMDGCGGRQDNNLLALCIDNRIAAAVPGSIHLDTTEPDCAISAVRIGGGALSACGSQQLQPGAALEIDFFATDPDGHLDHYELAVLFDQSSTRNLLDVGEVGTSSWTVHSGGPIGPTYSQAVTAATRPIWNGGSFTLHVDDAAKVFPKTCCYLLLLTAYKRNIVGCAGDYPYYNQASYSFTVIV